MLSCICLSLFYTLIVWFTLARGFPVKQASGLQPRASAVLGSFLIFGTAFLPAREGLPASWHFASAALAFLSSALLLVILPHLGRSFSIMPEARHLVTSGPYAFVRHPLYLAEEIGIIAIFIQILSIPAALILVIHFCFQVRRIYNEEIVLAAAFPEYLAYQARTARLIPGIW
jgi:protein-S-isoprenylcysteine O-methyltransferase Ste14